MISLIIPVYNAEQYLDRCLASVVAQKCDSLEVIVINDGSTDGSLAIINKYAEINTRLQVYSFDNEGLGATVIKGVKIAKGDYIAFLDSDDYLENNAIKAIQTAILETTPDLVMYDFYETSELGKSVVTNKLEGRFYDDSNIDVIKDALYVNGSIPPARWNKVFKKELWVQIIPFLIKEQRVFEDVSSTMMLFDKINSCYYIKIPLLNYWQNNQSIMHNFNIKYFDSAVLLYKSLKTYFKSNEIPSKYFVNALKGVTVILSNMDNEIIKKANESFVMNKEMKSVVRQIGFYKMSIKDFIIYCLLKIHKYDAVVRLYKIRESNRKKKGV